jgi:hypothetical protein
MPHQPRFIALTQRVRQLFPHLGDPARAISDLPAHHEAAVNWAMTILMIPASPGPAEGCEPW